MSDEVHARPIDAEMRQSYLNYAMSVIVSRALPDARDGLKPVHRRILYAMSEQGLSHRAAPRKSARVVGEVLGKYHPHGDSAIYDAMVRLAQDWSLRYPLVQGQGNFGSIDGDNAAAMRYTEARMAKITARMLMDLDKETVAFAPNFDASLKEPTVLPSMAPNMLINGADGIAVGMATKIPPHNLKEVCTAAIAILDDPEILVDDLIEMVPGPDFPTGGVIYGRTGPTAAAREGRGRIVVRGSYEIEKMANDRDRIVFNEIPYQTNKAHILMKIADLAKDKVIEGISDLRDESDRRGMRMVIELKRDAVTDVVLNLLWKHTQLQDSFSANVLALVNGRPRVLGLRESLDVFLNHRREVVTKRTEYDLRKAEERIHIVLGLLTAVDNIDAVIKTIRGSDNTDAARDALMAQFALSELQAKAILDMTLRKLTGLETMQLRDEQTELEGMIARFQEILGNDTIRDGLIREELGSLIEEFGDERRTRIEDAELDVDMEDLIPREPSVYIHTQEGYVKRMPLDTYREQHRGGKGVKGHKAKDEDVVMGTTVGSSHDTVCFFTNTGRLHWLKGYRIPTGSRHARGKPVQNLIQLDEGERVETMLPVADFQEEGEYLFFATKHGVVKKTPLAAYGNVRAVGIKAINLRDGDELLAVRRTNGASDIVLASAMGKACRFDEDKARSMGRVSSGVRGMRLDEGDEVVALAVISEGQQLLSITRNGYGKRTPLEEYRKTNRGGKGVRTMVVNDRNGPIIAVRPVNGDEGVLLVSREGMVVRTRVSDISLIGRSTQGVRVMRLPESDELVVAAMLPAEDMEDELAEVAGEEGKPAAPDAPPAPEVPDESAAT